eukprot:3691906-Rhodomonas_salina.1
MRIWYPHHTLAQYRTSHSTIRKLSTAHRIAPYASSVPHHTYLSSSYRVAPYAISVTQIPQQHTLRRYRRSHSTLR